MPAIGSIIAGVGAAVKGAGIVVAFIPGGQAIGGGMILAGHATLITGLVLIPTTP